MMQGKVGALGDIGKQQGRQIYVLMRVIQGLLPAVLTGKEFEEPGVVNGIINHLLNVCTDAFFSKQPVVLIRECPVG